MHVNLRKKDDPQASLRGATLVVTKQSIKVTKNGLLPRNDSSLL
ncbi:hypothetical protein [Candidatus Tisiphia endosymbiont of Hybos culiciformis]